MPVVALEMVIAAIVEMGVERTWEEAKRRNSVIRILQKLGFKLDNPPADFDGIYAYSLVHYGVYKPESILNLFNQPLIMEAFRKAYEERDRAIFDGQIVEFLDSEVGQRLYHLDYDPRREFPEFEAIFLMIADRARTVVEVRQDQKLDDIHRSVQSIVSALSALEDPSEFQGEQRSTLHTPEEGSEQENNRDSSGLGSDLPCGETFARQAETYPVGTMSPDSPFYIERQADRDCWGYLTRGGACTIFAEAPRQMGKSSLMRRLTHKAEQELDVSTAFIDFDKISDVQLADDEAFLVELCLMIGDALGVLEAIDRYWSGRRSNLIKCSNYLSQHIIPAYGKPFILAMDEMERLLAVPWCTDFFGMLRTWHNDRAWDPVFTKVSLFLSSSTELHPFIDNPYRSPFNVAQILFLEDFTFSEAAELSRRYRSPVSDAQLRDLMELVGGHPFLTHLSLYLIAVQTCDFGTLLSKALSDNGPFAKHLDYYWRWLMDLPDYKERLFRICRHQTQPQDEIYYRLKGAGLIKGVGTEVVMRNRLYERYFLECLDG